MGIKGTVSETRVGDRDMVWIICTAMRLTTARVMAIASIAGTYDIDISRSSTQVSAPSRRSEPRPAVVAPVSGDSRAFSIGTTDWAAVSVIGTETATLGSGDEGTCSGTGAA